jgi:5-(carboxyamino)imidazole ribonucleotide synthase
VSAGVGILGGGQLGRMLALAAHSLGLRPRLLDPAPDACAGQVAPLLVGAYDDPALLAALGAGCEVVTFEFENVPAAALDALGQLGLPALPGRSSLATAQDRLAEKRLFAELGVATAPFAPVDGADQLEAAIAAVGLPAILKTRRLGYDGHGQVALDAAGDQRRALASLAGAPALLEARVPFARELSIVAVRGSDGAVATYPLTENRHEGGILRRSLAPAEASPALRAAADEIAGRVLERLGHVGVLAVELFELDGRLLANELAPRVHNSGHWTIEGAETSQFENHLRAVLGLPLGSTAARSPAGMVNLLGALPEPASLLAIPGAHLHDYGKAPRPGRKLGHVTLLAPDAATLAERVARVEAAISA